MSPPFCSSKSKTILVSVPFFFSSFLLRDKCSHSYQKQVSPWVFWSFPAFPKTSIFELSHPCPLPSLLCRSFLSWEETLDLQILYICFNTHSQFVDCHFSFFVVSFDEHVFLNVIKLLNFSCFMLLYHIYNILPYAEVITYFIFYF